MGSSKHSHDDTYQPRRRTLLGGALASALAWLGLRGKRASSGQAPGDEPARPGSGKDGDDDDGPIWLGHM